MTCLEEKENWQRERISSFGKLALEEILEGYSFPTVVIALLLLNEMTQLLKTTKKERL